MIFIFIVIIAKFISDLKIFQDESRCYLGSTQDYKFPKDNKIKLVRAHKYVENRTIGIQKKIPYFIYQTHQNDQITQRMSLAVNSILQKNPDFSYRYFNSTQRREFMKQYMGQTLLSVYDKHAPATSKSDIFRYSIIYYYGGCYFDGGFVVSNSINQLIKENTQYITVRDGLYNLDFDSRVHSAFICAIPRSPILQAMLNNITMSTAKQDYGVGPLDMTGPVKLNYVFLQFVPEALVQNKVKAGYFQNNTIIVYQSMNYQVNCQTIVFIDAFGQTMISHRYPFYRAELRSLYGKSYPQYYFERKSLDKSIIIPNVDNYNVSTELLTGLRDYRIPLLIK